MFGRPARSFSRTFRHNRSYFIGDTGEGKTATAPALNLCRSMTPLPNGFAAFDLQFVQSSSTGGRLTLVRTFLENPQWPAPPTPMRQVARWLTILPIACLCLRIFDNLTDFVTSGQRPAPSSRSGGDCEETFALSQVTSCCTGSVPCRTGAGSFCGPTNKPPPAKQRRAAANTGGQAWMLDSLRPGLCCRHQTAPQYSPHDS